MWGYSVTHFICLRAGCQLPPISPALPVAVCDKNDTSAKRGMIIDINVWVPELNVDY